MAFDINQFPPPPADFTPEGNLKKVAKVGAREVAGVVTGAIGGITEFAGGAIKATGQAIDYGANIFNRLSGKGELEVAGLATQPVGEFVREKGEITSEMSNEIIEKATGKESVLSEPVRWASREIVAPIITFNSLAGKVGKAKNIFSAFRNSNMATAGRGLTKTFDVMEKVLPYATRSIARTEIRIAGSKGRLATPQELAIGIVADAAFSTAGHYLKKMAPELFRIGINPKGKDARDIVNKATAAVNKGYVGTMKGVQKQANGVLKKDGSMLDDLLLRDNAKATRESIVAKGREFIKRAADTGDETTVKAITKRLDTFIGASIKKLNRTKANEIKRVVGKEIANLFDKGVIADPKIAAQKQALVVIWQGLDDFVGGASKEVKRLNGNMNLAFSLLDPIEKSLRKPIINAGNLIGIFKSLPTTFVGSTTAQLARGLGAASGTETARFGARALIGDEGSEDREIKDKRNESGAFERRVPIPANQSQGMPEITFTPSL